VGTKRLSKKQSAVIDDIFAGELDEQAILERHGVSRAVFNKWLGQKVFGAEIDRRTKWLNRQSEVIIARYKSLAAARLVQLTDSKEGETARKACVDIISLPRQRAQKTRAAAEQAPGDRQADEPRLSPQTASRLLAALAEEDGHAR
jgi:hypothetical protein